MNTLNIHWQNTDIVKHRDISRSCSRHVGNVSLLVTSLKSTDDTLAPGMSVDWSPLTPLLFVRIGSATVQRSEYIPSSLKMNTKDAHPYPTPDSNTVSRIAQLVMNTLISILLVSASAMVARYKLQWRFK